MEKVLQVLKAERPEYVSGEALGRLVGISRAGIWKKIRQLRQLGYEIEASPHKGYRLTKITSILQPLEIQEGLTTNSLGRLVYQQDQVGSTNQWARVLAEAGAAEGTLVIAESQTQGRGRLGRSWESPPGLGLCFTLVLRPQLSATNLTGVNLLAAVSLAQAIQTTSGIQVQIKWPNDLVFQGQKLAGILAELSGELGRINYMVLGIGLNVNQSSTDFPTDLQGRATSLRLISGRIWDRKPLLQQFLCNFELAYQGLLAGDFGASLDYAREHSATLGRMVTIDQGVGQQVLTGMALELDQDGSLWLQETAQGRIRVYAGELATTIKGETS